MKHSGRKCPVCKELVCFGDLRPARFQYVTDASKIRTFVRVCKDPERPGVVCLDLERLEDEKTMRMLQEKHGRNNSTMQEGSVATGSSSGSASTSGTSSSKSASPSYTSKTNTFASNLGHLPFNLPREGLTPGWHMSRVVVASEANLLRDRKNDLLGLLKLAHETKRPERFSADADTEMLPFLDFLIQQELRGLYCPTKEEFLRQNTRPCSTVGLGNEHSATGTNSTLAKNEPPRRMQQLYEDIVYDKKLHEVRVDFESNIVALYKGYREIYSATSSVAEEVAATQAERAHTSLQLGRADVDAEDTAIAYASSTTAGKTALNTRKSSTEEDEWFVARTEPEASNSSSSGASSSSGSPVKVAVDKMSVLEDALAHPNGSNIDRDNFFVFYQSWDSQAIFINPFLLNVLRHDRQLPFVLDVRDPSKCLPPLGSGRSSSSDGHHGFHGVQGRLFGREMDAISPDSRKTNALFKRLPLRLEVSVVEFDIAPFVQFSTLDHFRDELWRRQAEKQNKKKRQRADEKWVANRAKHADEKLMEELKKQSWLGAGAGSGGNSHLNYSLPTAEDFGLSLALSKKVAAHEARTKKKITDEELALLVSAHEEEERIAAAEERSQRLASEQAAQREREERAKKAIVKDAWGSDDEDHGYLSTSRGGSPPARGGTALKNGYDRLSAALCTSSSKNTGPPVNKWAGGGTNSGNAKAAGKSRTGSSDTGDAATSTLTFAQKIQQKKQAELQKKREDEQKQQYFPSLAESLGGMVAVGRGAKSKSAKKPVSRMAIFGSGDDSSTKDKSSSGVDDGHINKTSTTSGTSTSTTPGKGTSSSLSSLACKKNLPQRPTTASANSSTGGSSPVVASSALVREQVQNADASASSSSPTMEATNSLPIGAGTTEDVNSTKDTPAFCSPIRLLGENPNINADETEAGSASLATPTPLPHAGSSEMNIAGDFSSHPTSSAAASETAQPTATASTAPTPTESSNSRKKKKPQKIRLFG
ncbi:unnamed protein product [Amoebophrya sp. A25]|nr:unnamed protein product [Amoebophrya sp. A25]|eukprot:GSA25T00000962001.1